MFASTSRAGLPFAGAHHEAAFGLTAINDRPPGSCFVRGPRARFPEWDTPFEEPPGTRLRFDLLATAASAEDLLAASPLYFRWPSASCGLRCESWMASRSADHLASSLAVISLFWASVSDEFFFLVRDRPFPDCDFLSGQNPPAVSRTCLTATSNPLSPGRTRRDRQSDTHVRCQRRPLHADYDRAQALIQKLFL
jgi:hypothetical protein